MKKAIISLLVAGAVIAANAQDKALLETLVKKGMLTQQEAAQIAKDSVAVTPATKSTKSIKIFGGGQGWYSWGKNSVKAGTGSFDQQSGFTLRYAKLGIEADVGGGWSAEVVTDFGTEGASKNYLDKVVASKKIDLDYLNGTLQLGLRKVNMGYEQNMDDFGQYAVERSVATYFFTRYEGKNFGSRTVGVFWDGNITQVDGLYYGAAVTSGVSEGGRTGLTAVTTAILFGLALFLSPIFLAIPSFATAPALIIVGFLMFTAVTGINFSDPTEAIPAYIAILAMPFTYSIAEGISFGIITYTVMNALTGNGKKISALMYILTILFIGKYIFL